MEFSQAVVRPAIRRRSGQRTPELLLGFAVTTRLQQGGGEGLADRVVPIRRLSVGQGVLQRGRAFNSNDGSTVVAIGLGDAGEDQRLRDAKHLVRWNV